MIDHGSHLEGVEFARTDSPAVEYVGAVDPSGGNEGRKLGTDTIWHPQGPAVPCRDSISGNYSQVFGHYAVVDPSSSQHVKHVKPLTNR